MPTCCTTGYKIFSVWDCLAACQNKRTKDIPFIRVRPFKYIPACTQSDKCSDQATSVMCIYLVLYTKYSFSSELREFIQLSTIKLLALHSKLFCFSGSRRRHVNLHLKYFFFETAQDKFCVSLIFCGGLGNNFFNKFILMSLFLVMGF